MILLSKLTRGVSAMSLAVFVGLLTGCQTELADPSVRVLGARVASQSEEAARVELILELRNPNKMALPLVHADYTVRFGGAEVRMEEDVPNRTLPASGAQTLTLPAVVATKKGAGLVGASFSATGMVTYEPPGEIRRMATESGVPLPKAAFTGKGKIE